MSIKKIKDGDPARDTVIVEISRELYNTLDSIFHLPHTNAQSFLKIGGILYRKTGLDVIKKLGGLLDAVEENNASYSNKEDNPRVDIINQMRGIISKM